jgi:hypothetical protein
MSQDIDKGRARGATTNYIDTCILRSGEMIYNENTPDDATGLALKMICTTGAFGGLGGKKWVHWGAGKEADTGKWGELSTGIIGRGI